MNEQRNRPVPEDAPRVQRVETVPAQRAEGAPVQRMEDERPTPLFANDELEGYRTRWSGIQTGFVDEPRRAVEEADHLVTELMSRLTQSFTDERRHLEARWGEASGTNVSTEDLRQALRRYRSFFDRLLHI